MKVLTGGSGGIQFKLFVVILSASWYNRSNTEEYTSFSLQTEKVSSGFFDLNDDDLVDFVIIGECDDFGV